MKDFQQVQWNSSLTEVDDEVLGRYCSPASPLRFDGQKFGTSRSPRSPGTHTEEVLRDWSVAR